MEDYLFIKYYYSLDKPINNFQEMQVQVEDALEEYFKDKTKVYLYFIDVTFGAYLEDMAEVGHTMILSIEQKKHIASTLREYVKFSNADLEIDDKEIYDNVLDKKAYLSNLIFNYVDFNNIIVQGE
jgi:hypothetical protein